MTKKTLFNQNQLSLPFDKVRATALALPYEIREKVFIALFGLCLVSIASYIYAVNATAHHVAQRASLERESGDLTAELATLEFQYIGLKSQVTMGTAESLGFQEVKAPLYVSKNDVPSLSFNK